MIFLLPPSESKDPGGKMMSTALSFKELNKTRKFLQQSLVELCENPIHAARALKLGPKQLDEIQVNLELPNPKRMPALDRYTGTLYDALKLGGVSAAMRARASTNVFIQSSLFGLISAADQIPNYRLSASTKLPGVNLKNLWREAHKEIWSNLSAELVIDLRSNSYADLAPVPANINCYTLDVVIEDGNGKRTKLNHFNKQAKGQFVRSGLLIKPAPTSVDDLKKVAKLANLKLEISGKKLLLITHG